MAETFPLPKKLTTKSTFSRKDRNLKIIFGDGYSQRAADGLNSIQEIWNLQLAPLTGTELALFTTFLSTVGTTSWFYWTPFGEMSSKKWVIEENSIKKRLITSDTLAYNFKIIQVFDLV